MKKINKLTACFLAAVMSFMPVAFAENDTELLTEAEVSTAIEAVSVADEWTLPEAYNGTVVFNDTKTDVQLNCKTTGRTMASVEAVSPAIDTEEGENGVIRLKFDLSASGFGANQTALISAYNPAASYAAELFRLNGTTLTVFGTSTATLEEETVLNIDAIFNIDTKEYTVTINDETVFSGENENISYLDKTDVRIQMQSFWIRNIVAETTLDLKNMDFTSDKSFVLHGFYAKESQIGSICALGEVENGVTVRFDGIGSDAMYTKENYEVSVNGETVDFEVQKTNKGAVIFFPGGLYAGDDVLIYIKSVEDVFGNVYDGSDSISFKVAGSDYISPKVEISCYKTELVLGETAELSISLTGTDWIDVKLYVNGEYEDSFEQEQFTFEFTPDQASEYTIKAVVTDEYNVVDEKEITVTFALNDAPTVSFDGFVAGETKSYQMTEEKDIIVMASDDEEVKCIELYLNGELIRTLSESEYTWNLDDDGVLLGNNEIKAVVYDMYGLQSEFVAYVEVTKQLMTEVLSEDAFTESSGKFGSGISVAREKGVARVKTIDDAHGASLVLGMDETYTEVTTGGYTHVNTSRNKTYLKQEYQFDMYVEKSPKLATGLTFGVRRSNGAVQTMMLVNDGELKFGNNTFNYEEQKWYRIKFYVSFENGNQYYDAYVDNTPIATGMSVDFSDASTGYRFFTTTDPENMCSIAVDNIKVLGEVKSFTINGVSNTVDEEPAEVIKPNTKQICVHIDGFVVTSDLNIENVLLYNGSVKKEIKRIAYNIEKGIIIIETEDSLLANNSYTVTFSENIRLIDDITIQSPMQYSFNTLSLDITVDEISRKIRKQNSEISVSVSNVSEQSKKIYVFGTVFDEGRFVKTELFSADVSAQSSSESFSFNISNSADKEIQVFVSDGINIGTIYKTTMYN